MKSATSLFKDMRRTEAKHVNWWIAIESTFLVVKENNSMKWKDSLGGSVLCKVFENKPVQGVHNFVSLQRMCILPLRKAVMF